MSEANVTQEFRTLGLHTPLGDDKLVLMDMHGSEELGQLFDYQLDLTADAPVVPKDILGKNVTIRLALSADDTRYFNGFVSRFTLARIDEDDPNKKVYHYRAEVVPWLWFLTRTSDCRIFQTKSVPDILREVFQDNGFTDFKMQLSGKHRTWEYCVQYRETDFNFISRLMEEEGIYYYFEQTNGKHFMVLVDVATAHKAPKNTSTLTFDKPDLGSEEDHFIWNWSMSQEITPTKSALHDFDPLQPKANLFAPSDVTHDHDSTKYEMFDYPGTYVTAEEGNNYAKIRMEEMESTYETAQATSSAKELFAGCTFKMDGHPVNDGEYLVVSSHYQLHNDEMGSGGKDDKQPEYLCQLTCIPKKYTFRAARATEKPVVQGPQTAIVVGPSGEEIFTDKYSRVKVKFHWDRLSKADEKSSCWIRVSQPVAGKGWGAISIPRIGQEVVVDFLEGDPDRPLITGRVYNGENMPPYALPANKTMSTFKSNSSKGGGGFNEFRFEDKKDDECIFMHAQKNMDIRVEHDRFENITNNRNLVVEKDKFEHVKNKRHELVDVDHIEEIKNDRNLKVGGKEAKEVTGSQSLKVTGAVIEEFKDKHSEVVTQDYYLKATNIVIEGTSSVTVKVGKNYLAIDSSGIKLGAEEPMATFETLSKGDSTLTATMNLNMEGKINAGLKAAAQLSLESQGMGSLKATGMLQVQSSAMLAMKGGMVMIN